MRETLKTKSRLFFCKRHLHLHYITKGNLYFVRVSPSLYQEEKNDSKSLEMLIYGENKDLNLRNTSPLFILLFLVTAT